MEYTLAVPRTAEFSRAGRWKYFEASVLTVAALAIAAVIYVTGQLLRYERKEAILSLAAENQSRVRMFEQYVLRTLDVAAATAARLNEENAIGKSGRVGFANSDLFTALGTIEGETAQFDPKGISLSRDEIDQLHSLARLRGDQRLYVSGPLKLTGFAKPQIAIIAAGGRENRSNVLFMEPRHFTELADQIPFQDADLISLIGLDGITRARRTGDTLSGGERVRGLVMERQLQDPNGSYLGPSVLDGQMRYFSHRRLPEYGLFATSGRPLTVVDARLHSRRAIQLTVMVATIVGIAAAAMLLMIANRRRRTQLRDTVMANVRLNEAQIIGAIGDWDYYPKEDRLYWSDHLLRMYRRSVDDRVSKLEDIQRYIKQEDLTRIEEALNGLLVTGEPTSWEVEVTLDDGTDSTRRVNAVPVVNSQGEITRIHGTDQDITPEARFRELEQKFAEVARLDAISALTATLAHELNQPLGIASNYLAAAQSLEQDKKDGKLSQYLRQAAVQLDHLAQIVAGARELVAHSGSHTEEIDLRTACDASLQLLKSALGSRKLRYSIDISADIPPVLFNRAQLKQVLFNLSKNGVEAVPLGRDPVIRVSATSDGPAVTVYVEDNGNGMPAGDPFAARVTTKKSGLGLGLALSRTIIESHLGRIWVEKTGPAGTVVAFSLEASV